MAVATLQPWAENEGQYQQLERKEAEGARKAAPVEAKLPFGDCCDCAHQHNSRPYRAGALHPPHALSRVLVHVPKRKRAGCMPCMYHTLSRVHVRAQASPWHALMRTRMRAGASTPPARSPASPSNSVRRQRSL
eukprot:335219-Chlamydomonas_euryale.AAC.2